jgi:hypothetical protein
MALPVPTVWAGVGQLFAYRQPDETQKWTTPYRLTRQTFVAMGRRPRPFGGTIETGTSANLNVPLDTPAWTMTALEDIWSTPKLRGQDLTVPYGRGEQAVQRMVGATDLSITLAINGDYLPDGTPTTNPHAGLARNVENVRMLQPNVYPARGHASWPPDTTGLREFWLWELHSAEYRPVYSGLVQVERIRVTREAANLAHAMLTLTAAVPLDLGTVGSTRSAWAPATGSTP